MIRLSLRCGVLLGVGLWTQGALGQAAPPAPAPVPAVAAPGAAAAAAAAPAPAPESASAPAPGSAPAPAPAPGTPSPYPVWNGRTASLLSQTFGTPHPQGVPGRAQRTEGIVAGVFGILSFTSAIIFSSAAKSAYNKTNAPGECVNDFCTSQGLSDRATARTLGDLATGSFVTGLLLVGSGTALFLTAPTYQKAVLEAGMGGVRVRGSF